MGELGRLIEQYQDEHWPRPTNADIAAVLEVARSTIGNWSDGTMPNPANLRALSRLIGVPYPTILEAVLVDAGYKMKAGERGGDTPANAQAGESPAVGKVVIPEKQQRQGASPKRKRGPRQ